MAKPCRLRKKVYVSRAIQGRLLARLGAYFVIYHLILWHLLFLAWELPFGRAASFAEHYVTFFVENGILLVYMACVLPILLWDMVKFSHRIAGPLVRFERALEQMTRGESVEPISLRKGDLLTEFLGVFNKFIVARNRERSAAVNSPAGRQQVPSGEDSAGASALPACRDESNPVESYARS